MSDRQDKDDSTQRLAEGLGWFSIALGLAEVAAPGSVARLIGLRPDSATVSTLRAFGLREIGSGIAILNDPRRSGRVWSRVGGDALDLAYLGRAMSRDDADRSKVGAATAAVLGVTVLDIICARGLSEGDTRPDRARPYEVRVDQTITVNRPAHEAYQFWRNFENLPRFMQHLISVENTGGRQSRWRAKGPAGSTVEWPAELSEERSGERLSWRSLEGADVENRGSVHFRPAPGKRGTEVRVQLLYRPPGGAAGRTIAWLFGEEPEQQLSDDLRRFKQVIETGEVTLSDGPGLWRAAQPPEAADELREFSGVQA